MNHGKKNVPKSLPFKKCIILFLNKNESYLTNV